MKLKIFLVVFMLLFLATVTRAEFRAAIAVRVVTPDPLLPVSGGIGPSNPVTKKEGDLTVRALVLADDNTKVAIVSADFLGFPSVLGDQARAKLKGIPPQNILIGATHTHSAPDRKSTRLNSSHLVISYAVFCLKKKNTNRRTH